MAMKIIDFGDRLLADAAQRVSRHLDQIDETVRLIAERRTVTADTKSRRKAYERREKELLREHAPIASDIGLEKKIGGDDIVSVEFLEIGLLAAKSVGRINKSLGAEYGTGFLVGHRILMTNHHVIPTPDAAYDCELELNVEANRIGRAISPQFYQMDPDRFFFTDKSHDLTLVAVVDHFGDRPPLEDFGWHPLIERQGKIRKGDVVNIIQHPGGGDKALVVHNSHLLHLDNRSSSQRFCWYSGDTEVGSSGAPVFNKHWEVIALHHKSVPKTNSNGDVVDVNGRAMSEERVNEKPEEIAWLANEGIRTSRLVETIKAATFDNPDQGQVRDELIAIWEEPGARHRGLIAAIEP